MNSLKIKLLLLITILFISACAENKNASTESKYKEIGWIDLHPDGEKLLEYYTTLESLDEFTDEELENNEDLIAPQAQSSGVVDQMNGKNVRLPGFIVPVEFGDDNLVTGFFLVPYFGACFHEPPPPPNQTVYVSSENPIKVDSVYDPVWVMGTMTTEQTDNDIATAVYKMNLDAHEPFTDYQ